jgi:hypothetical protein
MKFNNFLAFLFTLIAILIVISGLVLEYTRFIIGGDCAGYSLFLVPDEYEVDTEVGKGRLVKFRAINSGGFSDKYEVSLEGPDWAIIKPVSFSLKSEEAKTLFLYLSPNLEAEGKYNINVLVESDCISESQSIEVGVLK